MSGSAGGRAEQDSPSRRAPHRAADPTARLTKFRRLVHNSETLPATPDAVLRRASPADSARLGALISGRYPRNVSERRP
jgi:hypothetical protein